MGGNTQGHGAADNGYMKSQHPNPMNSMVTHSAMHNKFMRDMGSNVQNRVHKFGVNQKVRFVEHQKR